MRNPLSAMLMSADGIVDSLLAFQSTNVKTAIMSQELVESNLDAAQTIVLCAMHQQRIIDDVLTLSKLNSKMLQVTPVEVDVEDTVQRTLKMFESELQANDIQTTFEVGPSYIDAKIDKMFCDPVRLTQLIINLLTNLSFLSFSHSCKYSYATGYQIYSVREGATYFSQTWSFNVQAP
jgi:signal transduction histidine kinase